MLTLMDVKLSFFLIRCPFYHSLDLQKKHSINDRIDLGEEKYWVCYLQ